MNTVFDPVILMEGILKYFGYVPYVEAKHDLNPNSKGVDGFESLCNGLPKYQPRFISPYQAYLTRTTEQQVVIKLNRGIQLVLSEDGTWKEWTNR
jgi:hypothetical protein